MFSTSTQKKHWLFASREAIEKQRIAANQSFIEKNSDDAADFSLFLTPEEESVVCRVVEDIALQFCKTFQPPMPNCVVATAFTYFKRFYLRNSVMEHGAKNVMMACMFLACKVDEFNVSIDQFVKNLQSGTADNNIEIILSYELEVMFSLDYQLTVHCPYRPLEGIFLHLKTKCPEFGDVERLRPACDTFLSTILRTDAPLLFAPSHIALAAVYRAAKGNGTSVERFIGDHMTSSADQARKLIRLLENVCILHDAVRGNADDMNVMQKLRNCLNMLATKPVVHKRSLDDDEASENDISVKRARTFS